MCALHAAVSRVCVCVSDARVRNGAATAVRGPRSFGAPGAESQTPSMRLHERGAIMGSFDACVDQHCNSHFRPLHSTLNRTHAASRSPQRRRRATLSVAMGKNKAKKKLKALQKKQIDDTEAALEGE